EEKHVAYRNSDARGNREHGPAASRRNRRHRHLRTISLRPRIETRGHASRTDDHHSLRTHQPAPHAYRRSAPKAVSGKADRSEDAIGDWFDALRDVGPWLGSPDAAFVDLWIRRTSAGLAARLHAHDEVAVNSIEHRFDGDCAASVSRSGLAGVFAADTGLRHQLQALVIFDRTAGHRKDRRRRAHQQRAGRWNLDSLRG